ncbi:MAG: type II secretion system F family protein, partial [Methanogenium sp.]|nr:type II secretion system F family protein [Methanogenium sp.]
VTWRLEKKPLAYEAIRVDLVSARSGLTLKRYLLYATALSIIVGISFAVIAFFISSFIVIPQMSVGIYNIFDFHLPSVQVPTSFLYVMRGIAALFIFILASTFTYLLALWYPSMQKSNRSTRINLTLHNAIAYMYAMRWGGAELMDIFTSISENADIYGEVALECRQIVRDTEYFGLDMVSAIRHLSLTTPSEKMKDFLKDLLPVIESGGDISAFLASRLRTYQDEAKFEQKQFLATLQLVGEVYVTVFVVGPLFLVIILLVMGLMGGSEVVLMSAMIYGLIPIGSLVFIIFLDLISIGDDEVTKVRRMKELNEFTEVPLMKKDGETLLFDKMDKYDHTKWLRDFIRNPTTWFIMDPRRTFLLSVPFALVYVGYLFMAVPHYYDPELFYQVIDDHIIIGALIIMVPYGVFYEIWRHKLDSIEAEIPNFLDRLSGINKVGLTIAGAISILVMSNLGMISSEIRRIKRDIDWGANISDALVRFEIRVQTAGIARTVTLITKASEMSGNIVEVLNIASSAARMDVALKRERFSEIFMYTVIIYLAFFVFLFVVIVLDSQFLSLIMTMEMSSAGVEGFMEVGAM